MENLAFIAIGCVMLIFRKSFASLIIDFQNRVWGFRFGEREKKASIFVIVIVGLGFITLSLLAIFGVIHKRGT
jgi:uncharacterized membrane protein (Fun14 family)